MTAQELTISIYLLSLDTQRAKDSKLGKALNYDDHNCMSKLCKEVFS